MTALVASGCPTTAGVLSASCRARPASCASAFGGISRTTVVAFESPKRVGASLAVLAEVDPERPVAVCRELTKMHEEVVRGSAAELATRFADDPPRGEVALVVGGAPAISDEIGPALDAVRRLVEAGAKPRPAASVVSDLTGVPANRLYKALTERD